MKRFILGFFLIILIMTLGIAIGRWLAFDYLTKEVSIGNAHMALSHYSNYRDIVLAIDAGDAEYAKCRAELTATTMLQSLKSCLSNEVCKASVEKKAIDFAPEVIGKGSIPITPRRVCSPTNK